MKRLTIEEAELSPKHSKMIPIHWWSIKQEYREGEIRYRKLERFINKYINKSWDVCHSDFLHWVKSERRVNHGWHRIDIMNWFYEQFYSETWRISPYIIDSEGLIQFNPENIKRRKPRHCTSLYKLKPNIHVKEALRRAEKLCLYNQLLEGVSNETLVANFTFPLTNSLNSLGRQVCHCLCIGDMYFWQLRNEFTHFYVPIEHTKKEWKQIHYEKLSKQRKQEREAERHKKEMLEQDLHKLFWYADRAKEARIRKQKELERAEEELNVITRDRLGFDETSFKTFR